MPALTGELGRLGFFLILVSSSALAQPISSDPALKLIRGGGTPSVYRSNTPMLSTSSCPAIVNGNAGDIQPLQLAPPEVAAKNKLGCLSPNDAVYGSDGCPTRLCGEGQGVVPLPSAAKALDRNPQLPKP